MKTQKTKTKKKSTTEQLSPLDAIYETATGLYNAGVIDGKTMREFDSLCIPLVQELSPPQIKRVRLKAKVSQAIFAKYLNTSISTIKQWELGKKHPRGTSLKLLNLVANKGLEVLA